MDTVSAILGYGVVAMVVLTICLCLFGILLVALPALALGFMVGLPIWAWLEYGWGGAAALVILVAAVMLASRCRSGAGAWKRPVGQR